MASLLVEGFVERRVQNSENPSKQVWDAMLLRQEGTDEQLLPLTHGGLLLQLVSVTLGS